MNSKMIVNIYENSAFKNYKNREAIAALMHLLYYYQHSCFSLLEHYF